MDIQLPEIIQWKDPILKYPLHGSQGFGAVGVGWEASVGAHLYFPIHIPNNSKYQYPHLYHSTNVYAASSQDKNLLKP